MNRMIKYILPVVLIYTAVGFGNAAAQGSIVLRTQYPVQKQATWILVQSDDGSPVAGALVSATYRPGSNVSQLTEIGTTDRTGRVEWIPVDAGIVEITAAHPDSLISLQASTNTSVKFASPPISGIIIMVLAGVLLIGGSAVRFTRYIRGGGF
jgi:hypothetical protein